MLQVSTSFSVVHCTNVLVHCNTFKSCNFTFACVFILKGMKVACTHFQSAAGIFQFLKVTQGYSVYFGA